MHDGVHGPAGDVLEEIVQRGPSEFPAFVARLPAAPQAYRVSVLVGGLLLGPEVEAVCREVVRSRESKEKLAFMLGLGEIGHPETEGYFARILRETGPAEVMVAGVRSLGRIRGRKGLPLVIQALGHASLFAAACEALAAYGSQDAVTALLPRADELPALAALATLAAPEAREAFLGALDREPPRPAEGAKGLGGLGDPALGPQVAALLGSKDEATARAAFEAYAALGAPQGADPLLEVASAGLQPWMVAALEGVARPEVERFLVAAVTPARPKGFWRRLLWWSRDAPALEPRLAYRALREARDPEALAGLAARLEAESDPASLRELLACRALATDPRRAVALRALWKGDDLLKAYVAARVLLEEPAATFLAEALDLLGRPGFLELDRASGLADAERLLDVYAKDNNPFLLFGGFLDSGFVDLAGVEKAAAERLRTWVFPEAPFPGERFGTLEDGDLGAFLEALASAQPAAKEGVKRLWSLLADLRDGGEPLLDLFLCATGAHRGGLQRALARGIPLSLGTYLRERDDRSLPELDSVMAHLPMGGPLSGGLRKVFENARRALMAECRDITLILEGSPRGDMVLVERL
ncbi:MAG: hypothetical protein HZB55_09935 [Deltaproteobacteria bacterium]|nr:hypothetical protein [Deltaproteobacteria bacterium]